MTETGYLALGATPRRKQATQRRAPTREGCHPARSRRIHPSQGRMSRNAYVYSLANQRRGTLYTGVTIDLVRRLHQHRQHLLKGFTGRYDVIRLVWYAQGEDIVAAIALEKKIKNRGRQWKIDLIEKSNPAWTDLAAGWMDAVPLR